MIEFTDDDQDLTIKEIDRFIEEMDVQNFFHTRKVWHENFIKHFEKIMAARQVLTFRRERKLVGLCSYCIITKDREHDINKVRWTLPENISEGNIFYIDICLLRKRASIFKIKDYLVDKYKPMASEVFWYDMPHRKVFRLNFKGGALCPNQIAVC